jgi:gamma-glutamyltranspeptidase/glutathione hydrolase
MVASTVAPAVEVGSQILDQGGNAIDAAVATAFAAAVAHQFSSGVGGGGFILIHLASSGQSFAVDAREVAPASGHARMYLDESGELRPEASRHGGLAVAVPGLVQGLEEVQRRFGSLSWEQVLAPAIRMCKEGTPIGVHHRRMLELVQPRLEAYPETLRVQFPENSEVPPLGWKLVQPELARTLEAISREGSRAMTRGPVAEAIVAAARAHGGELTLEDLAGYRVRWRAAVTGSYRGHNIVSMPPPSSGGVHLVQMLNTLEPFDIGALGHNSSQHIQRVAGAMKLAFADRAVHLGDPDFYPVPVEWLTSKAYGLELAERLRPRPWYRKPPWRWGKPRVLRVEGASTPPPNDSGTTHISVLDTEGNAVALTQTVNTLFGSRITVPGTGIVLNNEMDDFSTAPGSANLWGVVGKEANAIAPGKRPLSSMTPTIVLRDGRPWLVSGSPMGPMIITTVLQTIMNVIDFGMDIQMAVSAPRFHHQWRPDKLFLEAGHPLDVLERLQRMGEPAELRGRSIGASASVLYDPGTGTFYGGVDPRRDTAAQGP